MAFILVPDFTFQGNFPVVLMGTPSFLLCFTRGDTLSHKVIHASAPAKESAQHIAEDWCRVMRKRHNELWVITSIEPVRLPRFAVTFEDWNGDRVTVGPVPGYCKSAAQVVADRVVFDGYYKDIVCISPLSEQSDTVEVLLPGAQKAAAWYV